MIESPAIELTGDGSQTLRHPVTGETYHSLRGAVGESMHVFIENGLKRIDKNEINILEVGFGSGLNALLTLHHCRKSAVSIRYEAVELYPVPVDVAASMEYAGHENFMDIHLAEWDVPVRIAPSFTLVKRHCDLEYTEFGAIFDLIYFDAFAPDTQPSLWTAEIFNRLWQATSPGGILVTYSAKGSVKQALRQAGYEVERLDGALGKRHMVRATKPAR